MSEFTETLPGGHRLLTLRSCSSTNDVARRGVAAGTLGPGDVVLAEDQTAGRGRHGRTWITLPGNSLAVSVVLATPPLERPARLTLLAAVAAARALEAAGAAPIAIKWPNDLVRGELKLGGLLVESAVPPGGSACCVLGCGLNLAVDPADVPRELQGRVGAAGVATDAGSRRALLVGLLAELDEALAQLGTPADRARGEEYRRRAWLTGRQVVVSAAGRELAGQVIDTNADGDLHLQPGGWLRGETLQLLAVRAATGPDRPPLIAGDAAIEAFRPQT